MLFKMFIGIEMAGTAGQFNSVLISSAWEYVLAVVFSAPTADSVDPLSKAMADYLADPKSAIEVSGWRAVEKSMWYNNPSKVLSQKIIVQSFANFAEVNKENKKLKFAVTCSGGSGYGDGPASTKLYTGSGGVDPENKIAIEIPGKPCKAEILKADEPDSAVLKWEKPEIGGDSVTSYTITLKHEASGEEKKFTCAADHDHDTPLQLSLPALKKKRTATYVAVIQANTFKINNTTYDVGLSEKHEIQFDFPFPPELEPLPKDMALEESA